MKVFLILFATFLFVKAQVRPECGCAPAPPVCASNLKTYDSECDMHCSGPGSDTLQVLYRGTCEDLIRMLTSNNNFNLYNPYPYNPYYNPNYNPYYPDLYLGFKN
ncbi:uncharacterized protein LOC123703110 isoform X3 [Colias croceus]|uniref:uncharacterized protein LOC123703110 isoform X3 n=1 Tax=Colias crocea TaxID=72248 RepID=UPI001E27E71B|nr:uncharacterized protein LOC123703110 isoform X3 [Colias croceus]